MLQIPAELLDLFGTEPSTQSVIARSCSEPGTPSITLSSPAIGPKGGPAYATLPASDELGTFEGLVTPSIQVPPGEYEAGHLPGFFNAPGGQLVQEMDMFAPARGAR